MSVVMFVLMLGFGGGGEPYLGRSLMWCQRVHLVALPYLGQLLATPGFSLILLLLILSHSRHGQCCSVGLCSTVPSLCFAPQYDYSFRTEQSAAARLPPSPTRCPPVPPS